jgi:hypothetical protein
MPPVPVDVLVRLSPPSGEAFPPSAAGAVPAPSLDAPHAAKPVAKRKAKTLVTVGSGLGNWSVFAITSP